MNDRMTKLQAVTGLVFLGFVVVHLANTWIALAGPDFYDGFQAAAQRIYQAWIIEALILTALGVHVACGIARMVTRKTAPANPRARWHRYSGILLAVVVFGHIAAVRGPSWFLDIYPRFGGVSFSLAYVPAWFYPYYFLFGLAAFYHGTNGALIALSRLGMHPVGAPWVQLPLATGVAAVLFAAALASFGGLLGPIPDPFDNDVARLGMSLAERIF